MIDLNTERIKDLCAPRDAEYKAAMIIRPFNLLHGLNDLCKEYITRDTVMLELGCNQGVSTALFSCYAKKVYTVDVQVCPEGLKGIYNVEHYQGRFEEVLTTFKECSLDFIYIDGCHDFDSVLRDIRGCLPLLKPGSPRGGHDYYLHDVQKAVEIAFGIMPKVFSDSSWVV